MSTLTSIVCLIGLTSVNCCLQLSEKEIKVQADKNVLVEALFNDPFTNGSKSSIDLIPQHKNIIDVTSSYTYFGNLKINVSALSAGKSEVIIKCNSSFESKTEESYIIVEVYQSEILKIISIVCGWLYFLLWAICYYPQLYDNYKTKSVVGLNLDTVTFGLFGYLMYNTFNIALYYVPAIKRQYSLRYPRGILPVLSNDLVFSMHGVVVASALAYQCLIYYREKQRVSIAGAAILTLCVLGVATTSVLAYFDIILWLDVLYLCSYIKMYGTIMLYLPQVLTNYKRRSTTGFSIKSVLIDVAGGVFCMIQIFMDGYNYDDWKTITENPAKFGIGVTTLGISVIFIIQHYILYPQRSKKTTQKGEVIVMTAVST